MQEKDLRFNWTVANTVLVQEPKLSLDEIHSNFENLAINDLYSGNSGNLRFNQILLKRYAKNFEENREGESFEQKTKAFRNYCQSDLVGELFVENFDFENVKIINFEGIPIFLVDKDNLTKDYENSGAFAHRDKGICIFIGKGSTWENIKKIVKHELIHFASKVLSTKFACMSENNNELENKKIKKFIEEFIAYSASDYQDESGNLGIFDTSPIKILKNYFYIQENEKDYGKYLEVAEIWSKVISLAAKDKTGKDLNKLKFALLKKVKNLADLQKIGEYYLSV